MLRQLSANEHPKIRQSPPRKPRAEERKRAPMANEAVKFTFCVLVFVLNFASFLVRFQPTPLCPVRYHPAVRFVRPLSFPSSRLPSCPSSSLHACLFRHLFRHPDSSSRFISSFSTTCLTEQPFASPFVSPFVHSPPKIFFCSIAVFGR